MNNSVSINPMRRPVEQLRILTVHWGQSGAGPLFTYELTKALASRDDVAVYLSYNINSDISERLAMIRVPALLVSTYSSRAGVVFGFPKCLINSYRLRRFVKSHEIDVVFSTMSSIWQSLAVRIYTPHPVKYIASVHDAVAHPGEEHSVKSMMLRADLRRADAVVAYSSSVRHALSSRSDLEGRVLIGTVHGTYGAIGSRRELAVDSVIKLGFFGRLVAYKGIDLLLGALDLLKESDSSKRYELHIYGDGDRGLVSAADSRSGVYVHVGYVPDKEVESIVASFDILVLPYKEASQSGPLSYAIGAGVPAVVTPVGALPEQVQHGRLGIVADSVSSESIARAIMLLTNPVRYSAISGAMVECAGGEYSWNRVAFDVVSGIRLTFVRPPIIAADLQA